MVTADQLTAVVTHHGEGPVWWPDDRSALASTLRCVDMLAGRVVTIAGENVISADVGSPVAAFIRPRVGGGAVVATEHGLAVAADPGLADLTPGVQPVSDPEVRFNDGACDPLGNIYCGTMRYDQATGGATLYRITPDGRVDVALDDVTISNGLCWTADGRRAYYNDTPTRTTWLFDWSPEEGLRGRRPLFRLADDATGEGPDGLCVDAEDTVWTAVFGGSRVEARDPAGRLVEVVEVPVSQVTACTFGGPELSTLYITTSREGLTDADEPQAGAIFVADVGVRGIPIRPFGDTPGPGTPT